MQAGTVKQVCLDDDDDNNNTFIFSMSLTCILRITSSMCGHRDCIFIIVSFLFAGLYGKRVDAPHSNK